MAISGPNLMPDRTSARAVTALRAAGAIVFVFSVGAGAARLIVRVQASESMAAAWWDFGVWVAVGAAVGAVLIGMGATLRALHDLYAALVRVERFQYEIRPDAPSSTDAASPPPPPAPPPGAPEMPRVEAAPTTAQWQELLLILRDLRDNALLSDEERREKKLRVRQDEIRNAQIMVRTLLERHDFAAARELAGQLRQTHPDEPEAAALADEVEQARVKREADDIRQCAKQVNDLISISAWQRARELADQLAQRHPDSDEPRQIQTRIEREYTVFQAEQRRRMYAEIQRYVSRKRWGEALAAAQTFMERFPSCDETESLRVQLPTLKTNAEIEVRQQLEAEIMDLGRHGRYIEAAQLARKLIERYPSSPQAEVLRSQLPRLDALANDPTAPPARVRVD